MLLINYPRTGDRTIDQGKINPKDGARLRVADLPLRCHRDLLFQA